MPAAAVIPAPIAYIKVAAVKKLVVGFVARPSRGGPHFTEILLLVPRDERGRVASRRGCGCNARSPKSSRPRNKPNVESESSVEGSPTEHYLYVTTKTFSDGCLGSHSDEERSKMQYVSHQNFERTLRFRENPWEHACRSVFQIQPLDPRGKEGERDICAGVRRTVRVTAKNNRVHQRTLRKCKGPVHRRRTPRLHPGPPIKQENPLNLSI